MRLSTNCHVRPCWAHADRVLLTGFQPSNTLATNFTRCLRRVLGFSAASLKASSRLSIGAHVAIRLSVSLATSMSPRNSEFGAPFRHRLLHCQGTQAFHSASSLRGPKFRTEPLSRWPALCGARLGLFIGVNGAPPIKRKTVVVWSPHWNAKFEFSRF